MILRGLALYLIAFSASLSVYAQKDNAAEILVDAVSFKGESDTSNRLDVYLAVPYSSLQFIASNSNFTAEYEAVITLRDSLGRKLQAKSISRRCSVSDFGTTQGVRGAADYSQSVFTTPSGKTTIEIVVTDAVAKRDINSTIQANIPRYQPRLMALSDLLLVSSIEEIDGNYAITPYISTNIGRLTETFFVFFESYNNTSDIEDADFIYEILDGQGVVTQRGNRTKQSIKGDFAQHYLPIPPQKNISAGKYSLRITMLKNSGKTEAAYLPSDVLAVSTRSITIERTLAENGGKDLDILVRQMLYVASQSDIDYIREANTPDEKQRRFEEFWQRLDPTPGTDKNEAMDEYYKRIEQANQKFRTFRDGWLSDMGAVYIIFGPPVNTERSPAVSSSSRNIVRWTMANNRQFTFIDDMGFGEYRLTSPLSPADKYRYGY